MRKLAIVGTHPETRSNAPFGDPEYDIWCFNEAPQAEWCKRWTACFQMHKPEVYTSPLNMVRGDHWDWLQQDHGHDKTIWMQEKDARVPCSSRYPLDEMLTQLPAFTPLGDGQPFITSSVAMAIALALYLGYECIDIHGVDLSSNTEYSYQNPGWMYWAGVARGLLGENFRILSGRQHFKSRMYAYEGETQIERDFFAQRAAKYESEKRQLENRAKKMMDAFNEATSKGQAEKLPGIFVEAHNNAVRLGEVAGALQEAAQYAAREDPISRQQFERRGAQAQEDGEKLRGLMDKESGKLEYVFNAWKLTGNANALNQMRQFLSAYLDMGFKVGGFLGVMRENFTYLGEYDSRVTAAGGQRTLHALGVQ